MACFSSALQHPLTDFSWLWLKSTAWVDWDPDTLEHDAFPYPDGTPDCNEEKQWHWGSTQAMSRCIVISQREYLQVCCLVMNNNDTEEVSLLPQCPCSVLTRTEHGVKMTADCYLSFPLSFGVWQWNRSRSEAKRRVSQEVWHCFIIRVFCQPAI